MSDGSKIEWTSATWSPTTGCDRISPGCDHCYALTLANRLKAMGSPKYQRDGSPRTSGPGFGVTVHPSAVNLPLRWRKPRRVFVNAMSDLFHVDIPYPWLADIFAVMAAAQRHTFQVLTKRPARMRSLLNNPAFLDQVWDRATGKGMKPADWAWPLPNVHLGISAEDQHWSDIRIPALLGTPAAVRFVSAEPLLGPIAMRAALLVGAYFEPTEGIGWVIAGGESGPGARPCKLGWLRSLRDQCADADVPFFVKQLGSVLGRELGAGSKGGDWDAWPEDLRVREFPRAAEAVSRGA